METLGQNYARAALGATYLGGGKSRFEVWAPLAARVEAHVVAPRDRVVVLEPAPRGYHCAIADGVELARNLTNAPSNEVSPETLAREAAALLSSFCMVRILHFAASAPIQPFSLLERLRNRGCPVTPARLNRILLRMQRNRWLRRKTSSGTAPASRRAYLLARKDPDRPVDVPR